MTPVYVLGGKDRGRWLTLEFDDEHLRGAKVVNPDTGDVIEEIVPAKSNAGRGPP